MPTYEAHLERFRAANAQVVGVSCDPRPSLVAWAKDLGGISYPLLSDFWPHGEVTRRYGVFMEERGMPSRALFIVDGTGMVRYIDVHAIGEQPDEDVLFEQLAQITGG